MLPVPTKSYRFPNQFAPPEVKNSAEYCRQYAEAFHYESAHLPTEGALFRNNKNYTRYRQYARGEQSILQYKELMGLKRVSDGKPMNTSFRNLNFEILKIAPKIRNVVVNKVVNQNMTLNVKATDPTSTTEELQYKSSLLEFMVNKESIDAFEKTYAIQLDRPFSPDEMPPSDISEVDPYVKMNPKDISCMEILDVLNRNFDDNNWKQLGLEIAGDLFDAGVAGTRQYIDPSNEVKFRRIIPERCICNKCILTDFRDLIRFGEYIEVTVSELKRITNGSWGEEAYKEIANKVSAGHPYRNVAASYFDASSYTYAYDHEKVTVLDCMWLSTDTEVYTTFKNGSGNNRVKKESFNYRPFRGQMDINNGQGMSDKEFEAYHQGNRKIIRREVRNVYTCCWVVDTKYVYNFGLMKNMMRSVNRPQETRLPVTLFTTDFMATVGLIEQPLDQVQLNYLQYQSHVAASKPPGIAVELGSLARMSGGGPNKRIDPKEALQMYAETGNYVYNGTDANGNPVQGYPFQELKNGLSEGAAQHFEEILKWISIIRQTVGINDLTEGQTPPERLGKSVAELSVGATDNALSHLTRAFQSIFIGTAVNTWYMFQNNIQRMSQEQIENSLGHETYRYLTINKGLGLKEFGFTLEEGLDDTTIQGIFTTLDQMVANQEIPGEDAVMIKMNIKNPYRQILMIRKHRIELMRQQQQQQEQNMRVQGEENTKTAVATEEAKRQTQAEAFQQDVQKMQMQASIESSRRREDFMYEAQMRRQEREFEMDEKQKDRDQDTLTEALANETILEKQKIANEKPKPNVTSK